METAAGIRDKMLVFGNDYDTEDGTGVRDYIHVNDLATAHVLAMRYLVDEKKDLIVNLGTGKGLSVLEMINAAEKITGKKINYEIVGRRAGDPAKIVASGDLAYKLLGWKAQHSDIDTIFKSMAPVYLK
jgi:UDP-glucose 4-epimerase